MSTNNPLVRPSRLSSLIEVEVTDAITPKDKRVHGLHKLSDDPLKALEELVEKMDSLEANAPNRTEIENRADQDEVAKALFEMQQRLEYFQRQSAVLKRLMSKIH
jgi:hypothetical protein